MTDVCRGGPDPLHAEQRVRNGAMAAYPTVRISDFLGGVSPARSSGHLRPSRTWGRSRPRSNPGFHLPRGNAVPKRSSLTGRPSTDAAPAKQTETTSEKRQRNDARRRGAVFKAATDLTPRPAPVSFKTVGPTAMEPGCVASETIAVACDSAWVVPDAHLLSAMPFIAP
jgi:hypothetical protein